MAPTETLAHRVIDAFGGKMAASKALDIPYTTIDSWERSGRIPRWWVREIRAAAERANVRLPRDFPKVAAA